jgi:hypothetical protein
VDYKDKGGKSWDVEIKEIKPRNLCALAVKRGQLDSIQNLLYDMLYDVLCDV